MDDYIFQHKTVIIDLDDESPINHLIRAIAVEERILMVIDMDDEEYKYVVTGIDLNLKKGTFIYMDNNKAAYETILNAIKYLAFLDQGEEGAYPSLWFHNTEDFKTTTISVNVINK